MAFFEWHEGLSVKCPELDVEHKHIMNYISDLHEAVEEDRGEEILAKTLDSVSAYCTYHFRHEENIFVNTDYPDKDLHIKEHHHFTKKIQELKESFRYGDHHKLSLDLLLYLKQWLINHIQGTDKGYIPYIQCIPTIKEENKP